MNVPILSQLSVVFRIQRRRWLPAFVLGATFCSLVACSAPQAEAVDDNAAGGNSSGGPSASSAGGASPAGACGDVPVSPTCGALDPVPTEPSAVDSFLAELAAPLDCPSAEPVADFGVIRQDAGDANLIMIGEVHGSSEQGRFSVELVKELVANQRLDAIALEIQMDVDDALAEYLQTGAGAIESTYAFSYWIKNAYRDLVVEARTLAAAGKSLSVHGIDVPLNLGWVHDKLAQLAAKIADGGVRDLVLSKLPQRVQYDAFQPPSPSGYIEEAAAYVAHLASNRSQICNALDKQDCEHLFALADALELGARRAKGGSKGGDYYARRETLMHHNMRRILANGSTRVLSHTGLYHAAKGGDTLARKLELEASTSRDVPYSLTVSYGAGSQLRYGNQLVDVGPSKDGVSSALMPLERDRYFVSTRWPGQSCQQNPLFERPTEFSGTSLSSTYGAAFDGLIWFRKLTPHP